MQQWGEMGLCITYFKIVPATDPATGDPGFRAVWFDRRKADTRTATTPVERCPVRPTRQGVRDSMAILFRDVAEYGKEYDNAQG